MKTRTSIHAGGRGCSPETQAFMDKALQMENKIINCTKNRGNLPPYEYQPPQVINPSGYVYPDRSGWCG